MLTELEFTEALLRQSKDTPPRSDKVKYSYIQNLSVDNESDLFRLYEESFATGQVQRIGHNVISNQYPNRKMAMQAERISYRRTPRES